MGFQTGENVLKLINDIVHEDTQVQSSGVDLTVNAIYEFSGAGALDFGGSEFEPAETKRIKPEKKHPDDDYGWWHLDPGTYLIEYNESVEPGEKTLLLTPLQRLIQAGASHASQVVSEETDPVRILLDVGDGGCHLKENCRVTSASVVNSEASI